MPIPGPEETVKRPLVSVVMPTRNRRRTLQHALGCVERQSYRDYELWLIDDASSDGTADYIRPEALRECFPRLPAVRILSNERRRGAAASRNRALRRAHGDYVAFLDDDDTWAPDYLERQVAHLDAKPAAAASYAGHQEVFPDGTVQAPDLEPLFDYGDPLVTLLAEASIHSMSVFCCRRSTIGSVGTMDERLTIVHDWDWYARILLDGGRIVRLGGKPLVRRRAPGGLVAAHGDWYREEAGVIERFARRNPAVARSRRRILAHRTLFFARTGLRRADPLFAARCLAMSLGRAPVHTLRLATRRLRRNRLAQRADRAGDYRRGASVE